jgi:hypothetical protein
MIPCASPGRSVWDRHDDVEQIAGDDTGAQRAEACDLAERHAGYDGWRGAAIASAVSTGFHRHRSLLSTPCEFLGKARIFRHARSASLRRKAVAQNRTAHLIANHANKLVASDSDEIQQYIFAAIAHDLKVPTDEGRSAISNGGYNGITVRVDERGSTRTGILQNGCGSWR